MHLPDYNGASILNLMVSIMLARGEERNQYAPLNLLPPAALSEVKHLVLIIVDGLGYDFLSGSTHAPTLNRYLNGKITSVFPSTTASAITTFLTGLAPQQHALTGWFNYLKEIDRIVAVLLGTDRYTAKPLAESGIDTASLFNHQPIFDRISTPSYTVVPKHIAYSAFNLSHNGPATLRPYASLKQFFEQLQRILRASRAPAFIYAYWPELDRIAHERGIESQAASRHLARFDTAFKQFLETADRDDSLIMITADHGFIDSGRNFLIELDHHPKLRETLSKPLCGERRVAYCYVRPSKRADFVSYVQSEWAEQMTLYESTELIERGFFGPGEPHPRLQGRIGDYTLIMKGRTTIKDWLPGEKRYWDIGTHGGVSHQEMQVPLIVVRSA